MASGAHKPEEWQLRLKKKYIEVLISYFDNICKDVRDHPKHLGYAFIMYNLSDKKMFTSISNMDNGSLAEFFSYYIKSEAHRVGELTDATDPRELHARIVKPKRKQIEHRAGETK